MTKSAGLLVLRSALLVSRRAISWGVGVTSSALALTVACGETVNREPPPSPAPSNQGGCSACGGEPEVAGAPLGGASAGGEPPTVDGGAGGEGAPPPPPAAPPEVILRAASISQTLEVPLVVDGRAVASDERTVPLVANKRALVRAFVDVSEGYEPRRLLGVLDLKNRDREHSVVSERLVRASSEPGSLESTFVFDVSADDLTLESSYRLRVLESDTTPLARFPESGFAALEPRQASTFRLVVVPYVANGFAPRVGEGELGALRRRLLALYPSREVEITVASPVTLGYPVDAQDAGWDDALDQIYELREKAAPSPEVFYYGVLAPAESYDSYCADGCLLGLSLVADAREPGERGSIGVGVFPDGSGATDALDTAAHELGHALGRDHAPCGIPSLGDTDPEWPSDPAHTNALIGVYGFDFDAMRLVKPRPSKDVMSYCTPAWISDYTYAGIFERLRSIAAESAASSALSPAQPVRVARIRRTGDSRWLAPRSRAGGGYGARVALLGADARVVGTAPARFVPVDHGVGGYVWLPEQGLVVPGAVSVDLRPFGGAVLPL